MIISSQKESVLRKAKGVVEAVEAPFRHKGVYIICNLHSGAKRRCPEL